eukprot:5191896-Prymnesium_polylepis.2
MRPKQPKGRFLRPVVTSPVECRAEFDYGTALYSLNRPQVSNSPKSGALQSGPLELIVSRRNSETALRSGPISSRQAPPLRPLSRSKA